MKLTRRNYFSPTNKYLSNSKLGDWLKDKHYFYRKNWIGDVEREITDPLILGSAVDTWIMDGEQKFRNKYMLVSRRSKASPDYEFQLNATMWDTVERMVKNVTSQEAYKKLRGFKSQTVLQVDEPVGIFPGICGIPDWFKVYEAKGDEPKKAVIVDLKTTEDATPNKYFHKCQDYGYFRQMAFYYLLIAKNFEVEFSNFTFRHLTVEKDKLNINNVYTFEMEHRRVKEAYEELINIFADIAKEKKFAPHNASWDNVIKL